MDLHPDQLEALRVVVDRGTFEAAARSLHVTPSAISQRMKALESAVGRVLLQRSKPVVLTESGQVVLRLARQFALLQSDADRALAGDADAARVTSIPLAVNADSLSTWVLPALAPLAVSHGLVFDIYREDQAFSTELLRRGTVMGAITSEADAVQGCTVRPIGRMRYRPMATPAFVERWLGGNATAGTPASTLTSDLSRAPMVIFDRRDTLQHDYLASRVTSDGADGTGNAPLGPPAHFIPASVDYAEAVQLGLGWGMLPHAQADAPEALGTIVEIDPGAFIEVPLYWQQWKLESEALAAIAAALEKAAPQL